MVAEGTHLMSRKRSELDRLRTFAVRVRMLPTIDTVDVPNPTKWDERGGADAYATGYNDAISKMREIFTEEGFSG